MAEPQIVYTRAAERDLEHLFEWIALDSSPRRAATILTRIKQTVATLAALPGMGRTRHDLDGAPSSFTVQSWIVIYEPLPDGEGVLVLRVVDGRRDLVRLRE